MFAPNTNHQLAFDDSTLGLTERERRVLADSWAQIFRDEIFPYIDEELFRVLYSDAYSRPNTPANVVFGAMLLKEIFHLSDDEVVYRLMFDVSFQYALQADRAQRLRLAGLPSHDELQGAAFERQDPLPL